MIGSQRGQLSGGQLKKKFWGVEMAVPYNNVYNITRLIIIVAKAVSDLRQMVRKKHFFHSVR